MNVSVIKVIVVAVILAIGGMGGYVYIIYQPVQNAVTQFSGFGIQPTAQPGTIDSSDAHSDDPSNLDRLRRKQ
ncbi:hypothetical protein ACR2R6_23390 (plasmid) [Methylocaldum gracile subsp. desertum]|uniref:hypothetical protein n=1 Tax=Methylocaldum sp. GT1BW TaxID=3438964 RepID=UPI003DA04D01